MTDPALTAATAATAHATLAASASANNNLRLAQQHGLAAQRWLDRIDVDSIEAQLQEAKVAILDARIDAARPPHEGDQLLALLGTCYEALRLTQEYATDGLLPNLPGWSHYDARVLAHPVLVAAGLDVAWPERTDPDDQVVDAVIVDDDDDDDLTTDPTVGTYLTPDQDDTIVGLIGRLAPDHERPPYATLAESLDTAEVLIEALRGAVYAITGTSLAIAHERRRQVTHEGYTTDHDVAHTAGELLAAGACYLSIVHEGADGLLTSPTDPPVPGSWPWEPEAWNPSTDPVRNLVKGGALVAAEGDRQAARTMPPEEVF